jgi:hypothetical protein
MKRHRDELLPEIKIEVVYQEEQERIDPLGGSVETAREQADTRHKWLTCMDEFADFIQGVDPPLPLREEVIIGLIDDGVDINEQSLDSKIIGGRSYCQRDRFLSRPYYVSNGGHGTLMATLICRVCPKAQLYVVKLEERRSENMKRQITARSAARVRYLEPSFPGAYKDIAKSHILGRPSSNRQKSSHNIYVLDYRTHQGKRRRHSRSRGCY